MKLYIYRAAATERGRAQHLPQPEPGSSSVRFGNDVLVFSNPPELKRAELQRAAAVATKDARMAGGEIEVNRDRMHVVVQNGRLFEQHHPDVPVIHERGRFLLVDIEPEKARSCPMRMRPALAYFLWQTMRSCSIPASELPGVRRLDSFRAWWTR